MDGERQVTGARVDGFPSRRRLRRDFGEVADDHAHLLREGRDFELEVYSLAAAARRWAREYGYALTIRRKFEDRRVKRRKVGLNVRFEQRHGRRHPGDGGALDELLADRQAEPLDGQPGRAFEALADIGPESSIVRNRWS
jgi:hypothetical protein